MKSLSSVGLGLSIVFCCLLLALVAEVYYLLWWKKRITTNNREIENHNYGNPFKELLYMFCWKKPSPSTLSLSSSSLRHNTGFTCSSMSTSDTLVHDPESQTNNKEFHFKPFGEDAEYMRQQELLGPPRFLFTIVEESKEDLESDDGKSKGKGSRGRSLGDLLVVETPYLTPNASPSFFTPPFTPSSPYNQHGFNPLFESTTESEFNRIKSSPPPKFKFLQEAEEKLRRKLQEGENNKGNNNVDEVDDCSTMTTIVDKKTEREVNNHSHHHNHHHHHNLPQHHSSSSQVLPLAS
ncbi:hypothetical protein HN51_068134 [Arachis hypogaea]|uniref:uncharacterized protein isoform X2 n=1 Tax=Arachis hypogaea TaxID=3818 RepID=UPI0034E777C9|nr:uncharacterized protein DS421_14g484680 [Arachis hypogaea]